MFLCVFLFIIVAILRKFGKLHTRSRMDCSWPSAPTRQTVGKNAKDRESATPRTMESLAGPYLVRAMLSTITNVNAHNILAKLIEAGAVPPLSTVVGTARSEQHGLQVIVMVSPYEGPLRIHPEILKQIEQIAVERKREASASAHSALNSTASVPEVAHPHSPNHHPLKERVRNDVEKAILSVVSDVPTPVKALAKLADYSYCGYFRDAVRRLVDEGLLERVEGGVRRRR